MFIVHAATRCHVDVHGPCVHVDICGLGCCQDIIQAATENHVEVSDP